MKKSEGRKQLRRKMHGIKMADAREKQKRNDHKFKSLSWVKR